MWKHKTGNITPYKDKDVVEPLEVDEPLKKEEEKDEGEL